MSSHYRSYLETSQKRKYRCIETIGSGAYGVVYKGIREDDKKDIALKRIFLKTSDNGAPLSTLRELSALSKLSKLSDTVVSVLDTIPNKIDGKYCIDIIFELFPCDLEIFLKDYGKEFVPMSKAISITIQLTEAINFMHQHCVIHRDIKPANILIDPSTYKIKVTDFGLARVLGWDAYLTPEVVTLWYRSPEVLLNQEYSFSCDVWSVGCIAGEMVYGRPLFPADDMFTQFTKIVCRMGPDVLSLIDENIRINEDVLLREKTLDYCLRRADETFQKIIKEMLNVHRKIRITSTVALKKLQSYEIHFKHNNSLASNSNSSFEYATIPSGSSTTSTSTGLLTKRPSCKQKQVVKNSSCKQKQVVKNPSIPCANSHFSFDTEQFVDKDDDDQQPSELVESVLRNVLEDELTNARNKHVNELADGRDKHVNELADGRDGHDNELADGIDGHDDELADGIDGHDDELTNGHDDELTDDNEFTDIEEHDNDFESDDDRHESFDADDFNDSYDRIEVVSPLPQTISSDTDEYYDDDDSDKGKIPEFCDSDTKGDSFNSYRNGTSISPITTASHKSIDYDYSTDDYIESHKKSITKIENNKSIDIINKSKEKNHNDTKENFGSNVSIPLKRTNSKPLEEDNSNHDKDEIVTSKDSCSKSPFLNKSRKRELNSSSETDIFNDSIIVTEPPIISKSNILSPTVNQQQHIGILRNPSLRRRVSQVSNCISTPGNNSNRNIFRSESVRIYRKQSKLVSHNNSSSSIKTTTKLADRSFGECSLNIALSTIQKDYPSTKMSPICHIKDIPPSFSSGSNTLITDRPRVIARRRSEFVKK